MPTTMEMDWVGVLLVFHAFLQLCLSDTSHPQATAEDRSNTILQKIEGTVEVKNSGSDDWIPATKVCLDGGEYCGFLKSSGGFVIRNVPPGSYLVEVYSPNFIFESVRVDISSKNGKIRARKVNLLKSTAVTHVDYPLNFQAEKQAEFFEKREAWSLLSTLKNPMVSPTCDGLCRSMW
jgi:hypothetical protein